MNKLITSNNGGYPFNLDDIRFVDSAYREGFKAVISPFADVENDALILSGMVRTQQGSVINYTEGYCVLFGEVLHFPPVNLPLLQAGQFEYLAVNVTFDVNGNKTQENGVQIQSYEVRKATIIRATSQPSMAVIWQFVKSFYKEVESKISVVPKGAIMMWSGNIANIPGGYALCDGTNGTPNLKGKFVVGYDANDVDYSAIGLIGGEKKHILTINEMPSHTHTETSRSFNMQGNGLAAGSTEADVTTTNTGATGGDQPHENRPPYYTIAYIIKL